MVGSLVCVVSNVLDTISTRNYNSNLQRFTVAQTSVHEMASRNIGSLEQILYEMKGLISSLHLHTCLPTA